MTVSNAHNIRVHAWLAGEETPYVGDGYDITSWVETLTDEELRAAAYTFEQSLIKDYEPQLVTMPTDVFDDAPFGKSFVSQSDGRVTLYMDVDEYEVTAFIRFNRPVLRDRMRFCICTARVGGTPDGLPCLCDAVLESAGQTCELCERDDHNFQGRS